MEDTLRVLRTLPQRLQLVVLILVLMEDTLRGKVFQPFRVQHEVLILVLMEDTLRDISTYSC